MSHRIRKLSLDRVPKAGRGAYCASNSPFTLVAIHITTGRTHQIRVHIADLAQRLNISPAGIVGDKKYLPATNFDHDAIWDYAGRL